MSDLFSPMPENLCNVQVVWESTQHLALSKILWPDIASKTYPRDRINGMTVWEVCVDPPLFTIHF